MTKQKETTETETKAVERPAPRDIHEARLRVYEAVGYVQKTGTLDAGKGGKYKYAGESDLIAALRPAMVEAGIVFHCEGIENVKHEEIRKVKVWDGKETVTTSFLVTGLFTFRFTHVGSGTHMDVRALGEGNDSLDKASYKAMTGALKYALRQTFIIETGDDPDETASGEGSVEKKKQDARTLEEKKAAERAKWEDWAGKYIAALAGFTKLSELQALGKDGEKNALLRTLNDLYPEMFKNIELARTANTLRLGGQPLAQPVEEPIGYYSLNVARKPRRSFGLIKKQ
jgi:ERF superfamily